MSEKNLLFQTPTALLRTSTVSLRMPTQSFRAERGIYLNGYPPEADSIILIFNL